MFDVADYALVRLLFRRGLAVVYLVAFLSTATQFKPLLGEDGVLPLGPYVEQVRFRDAPSLFQWVPSDRVITVCAWSGVALSVLALSGLTERFGTPVSMLVWALLWLLYLSFVNVGRIFYAFGWESLLLETGFLAIFLGGAGTTTPDVVIWLLRWLCFRVMFGAGLIKLRGDSCWRDLTCMFYHYETQPMPNPLSWHFDKLPDWLHKSSIGVHHVVELVVPFFYFAPPPFAWVAALAGLLTVVYQGWLMVSGNFSWLNFLTIVLAISTFDDALLDVLPMTPPQTTPEPLLELAVLGLAALVVVLSYWPVKNLLSSGQAMNRSFDPLHLVNTYGAFGSITRERYELVIEGTHDEQITEDTEWHAYEFKGKPTDVGKRPRQWAPYHLRLDWQLWFAAMTPRPRREWFPRFIRKLTDGGDVTALLARDPFPDEPPAHVRVRRYRYRYTTPEERRETGAWWRREFVNEYYGPIS